MQANPQHDSCRYAQACPTPPPPIHEHPQPPTSLTHLQAVAQHEWHAPLQARHPAEHGLHVADAKRRHEAQRAHGKGHLRGDGGAETHAWAGQGL